MAGNKHKVEVRCFIERYPEFPELWDITKKHKMADDSDTKRKPVEPLVSEEIGESPPQKALLFNGKEISLISGKSGDLMVNGYEPFIGTHLNTQHALMLTHALAKLHATTLRSADKDNSTESTKTGSCVVASLCNSLATKDKELQPACIECLTHCVEQETEPQSLEIDEYPADALTNLVSQPSIVEANLSIMMSSFEVNGVPSRILTKMEAIRQDVETITGFLKFLASSQTAKYIPSVGPISMSDIWFPKESEATNELLVIRLRGGVHLKALPFRDISWVWLTLVHPTILQERYMELCQSYCEAFNNAVMSSEAVPSIDLSDIVRCLGENFLHAFLTIVHKFVASGVWALDRQLHTHDGIRSLSSSISFLIENGIVGPIFVS